MKKKCLVCGIEFEKNPSCSLKEWKLKRRFCSVVCSNKAKKGLHVSPSTQFGNRPYEPWLKGTKGLIKPNSGSFKKGMIPWNKGKTGVQPPVWNKGKPWLEMRGEKHPNWKGNADVKYRLRVCLEYKHWRTAVFERDKYTCSMCLKPSNRLQVHHVIPFYKIIDSQNIQTYAEGQKCKLLWDINNGETLCIPCHKQTDSFKVNQHTL